MIAIYARQSVDKKDSISIDSQIDFCKKEISSSKDFKIYIDKGFSGGNIQRPSFENLLSDIKKNTITKVVVYKLDRISRSIIDFANIIDVFKKNKVEFVSATEKFDTSTPMGNAMLSITMVFAQLERETIQKRIKDNYYSRGKKGFFLGGTTPYGFTAAREKINGIETSILKVNQEIMSIVEDLFYKYSEEDYSLRKLAQELNKQEIKSPKGVNWDSIKIQRILRNPVYVKADAEVYVFFQSLGTTISNSISEFTGEKACFIFGKPNRNASKYTDIDQQILALSLHNGVIDSTIWLKCQYKLNSNKQIKNTGQGKHSWLSGLTKCGYCNYAMTVWKSREFKYFKCRGRVNYNACDENRSHKVESIENYVESELFKKIDELKNLDFKEKIENTLPEINKYKLEIIELDKQIENLVTQIAMTSGSTIDYINKKINELDSKRNELLQLINQKTISTSDTTKDLYNITQNINNWDSMSLDQKKKFVKTIISKVLIKQDEIRIEWKF